MAERNSNYRPRSRAVRGREQAGGNSADALAVAMTAQIIICVLLLLAAQAIKLADDKRFASIKGEYVGLAGAGADGSLSEYFSRLAGIGDGIFSWVENFFRDLSGRGSPESEQPQAPAPESAPERDAFNYGYLEAQEAAAGGSGSIPFQLAASPADMLPAPKGNTLAPYFLSSRLKPPVTGMITSPFAYREHPVSGGTDFHNGVDIASPYGKGILAALPGSVEEVGENDIYGNYLILRHTDKLKTFYAHCSQVVAREGMKVDRGERIAKVGDSGIATGPHLHFSVMVDGVYADPLYALRNYIQILE